MSKSIPVLPETVEATDVADVADVTDAAEANRGADVADVADEGVLQLPRGLRPGDRLTLDIVALDGDGLGTARVDADVGPQRQRKRYDVRVRHGLPGDRLDVVIARRARRRLQARTVAVVVASPLRTEARCRHFGPLERPDRGCGGCLLQHVAPRDQHAWKSERIGSLLAAAGFEAGVLRPLRAGPQPWRYRNKMELSFGDRGDGEVGLGMHPVGYRHEVVDLHECWLIAEASAALVAPFSARVRELGLQVHDQVRGSGWLRNLTIRDGLRTGERSIELVTSDADPIETTDGERTAASVVESLRETLEATATRLDTAVTAFAWTRVAAVRGEATRMETSVVAGRATLHERLELAGGHTLDFDIHPRAFFQPNTAGAELLYGEVLAAADLTSGAGTQWAALDLYCGTGTIALCLAPWVASVVGVELVAEAVDNARTNAARNDIDNVEFHAGDAAVVLAGLGAGAGHFDLVVVDPPRSGLMPAALAQVIALAPANLIYVSCNPVALVRDLQTLVEAGFTVATVTPVDHFPHTAHLECVASLRGPKL